LPQLGAFPKPKVDLQYAFSVFARLSPREQWFISAAGIMLGATLLYLLVGEPVWDAHARLRARVAAKGRELEEVKALRRAYQALQQVANQARPATGAAFSPFAFLEGLATSTIGRDKVAAINPVRRETRDGVEQETIELELQGISLRELVILLHKLNTASATLHPVRLSIKKRYKDPYTFDVFLTTLALAAR
jgi:type II secretory pathway component PulM